MNVISHAVYPVLIAQSVNLYRVYHRAPSAFKAKSLLLIGICGGLPDILSPHLGLEDRISGLIFREKWKDKIL